MKAETDWTASHHLVPPKDKRTFILARDIHIKAGEIVQINGKRKSQYHGDSVSILIATSKDTTAELIMPLQDAIEIGLVKTVEPEHEPWIRAKEPCPALD
jgi:hypothetical protein